MAEAFYAAHTDYRVVWMVKISSFLISYFICKQMSKSIRHAIFYFLSRSVTKVGSDVFRVIFTLVVPRRPKQQICKPAKRHAHVQPVPALDATLLTLRGERRLFPPPSPWTRTPDGRRRAVRRLHRQQRACRAFHLPGSCYPRSSLLPVSTAVARLADRIALLERHAQSPSRMRQALSTFHAEYARTPPMTPQTWTFTCLDVCASKFNSRC